MINPQQPRERIKRPEIPQFNPEPEEITSEELTQDDLNEWLTQKVIRLELETFRRESREGKVPLQKAQPSPVKKPQPYETMYGSTQEDIDKKSPPLKRKGFWNSKRIIMLVILIGLVCVMVYYAYQILINGYSFGG